MCHMSHMFFAGQYFKKNRLHLEVILSSWTGVGLGLMSVLQFWCLSSGGWTLGLQVMAGSLGGLCVLTSLLLRPASVYHPQRHAILHMRQYMRQILGKTRTKSRAATDLRSKLRHRSVRAVLAAASVSSIGLLCPLVTGASIGREAGMTEGQLVMLQVSLGLGQALGSYLAGRVCMYRRSRALPTSVITLSGLGLLLTQALASAPVSLVLSSVLAGCVNVSLRVLLYRHARYCHNLLPFLSSLFLSLSRSQFVSMASLLMLAQSLPTLVSVLVLASTSPGLAPLVSGLSCLAAGAGLALCALLASNKRKSRKC